MGTSLSHQIFGETGQINSGSCHQTRLWVSAFAFLSRCRILKIPLLHFLGRRQTGCRCHSILGEFVGFANRNARCIAYFVGSLSYSFFICLLINYSTYYEAKGCLFPSYLVVADSDGTQMALAPTLDLLPPHLLSRTLVILQNREVIGEYYLRS